MSFGPNAAAALRMQFVHVISLVPTINASEMNFPNAVCRGLLRLHTDVLAVGGCAGESSSARHPALSFSLRVIYAPLVH